MQWAPPNPNLRAAVAQMLGPSPTPMAQPAVTGFPAATGGGVSSLGDVGSMPAGGGSAGGGGGGGGSLDLTGIFSQLTGGGSAGGGDGSSGQQASGARTNVAAWVRPPNPNNPFVANADAQQKKLEQRQAALAAQQAAQSRARQQQRNAQMFTGVTGFGGPRPQPPTNPFQAQSFQAPTPRNNATNNGPMAQAFGQVFPTGGLF